MYDVLVSGIREGEKLMVGGDFNGHVGKENFGFSKVHGSWGMVIGIRKVRVYWERH